MRHLRVSSASFALVFVLLVAGGCNKSNSPPTPLALKELPAGFEKAFSKANPEVKSLADEIVKSVQAKDFAKAFLDIQNLSGMPELTKEQVSTVARSRLTLNELLQSAEAKGDEKAATTLENYRRTK
jgi:hypothetical protein